MPLSKELRNTVFTVSRVGCPTLGSIPNGSGDKRLFDSVQDGTDNAANHAALDGAGGVFVGQVLVDGVGQLGDGKRLQPDSSRASERSEKNAIPAENQIPDARHGSHLKRNAALESTDMAGVHAQGFAGTEVANDEFAGEFEPGSPLPGEFLQQKSVTTENASP